MVKVLDIRHTLTADEKLIPYGYILANHRSWTDFCLDPYLAKSCVVGRRMAFVAMNFFTVLGLFDGIIISFVRGKETREQLFARIKSHIEQNQTSHRALFFPRELA